MPLQSGLKKYARNTAKTSISQIDLANLKVLKGYVGAFGSGVVMSITPFFHSKIHHSRP
jgi:hypothetical protein